MVWISSDLEGMIITSSFHDSDCISIISDADRHYFRVRTAITLSRMPLNELCGGWEVGVVGVWHKERSHVPLLQFWMICKNSDVYS